MIRFDNITKQYGTHLALNKVSFEVPAGVVFALLGDNGAGKTTAIRIMLGLVEPDSGTSEVLGLNSQKDGLRIRQQVGYVAERPALYDWMNVDEVGWFAAGFYDDKYLQRYRKLVGEFHLPGNQKIGKLSKGMRAKVALSLALALDPALLILDEPTSGLDAIVRREFLESMVDRAAAGHTVFLSSHQINEVEKVADYVGIMHQGDLLIVEKLDEMKKNIREVTLTLRPGVTPPDLPAETLFDRVKNNQERIIARGIDDHTISTWAQHPAVQSIETHAPSLEEIFVAYMNGAEREEVRSQLVA